MPPPDKRLPAEAMSLIIFVAPTEVIPDKRLPAEIMPSGFGRLIIRIIGVEENKLRVALFQFHVINGHAFSQGDACGSDNDLNAMAGVACIIC